MLWVHISLKTMRRGCVLSLDLAVWALTPWKMVMQRPTTTHQPWHRLTAWVLSRHVCACVYAHVCVHPCACVFMCVCACVCVRVYACVLLQGKKLPSRPKDLREC